MSLDLTEREKDWESSCRTRPCPNCHAKPGKACRFVAGNGSGNYYNFISHTGRYLAAVDVGLVPEFAGGWRG
jgi:hypothetical protein